MPAVKEFVRAPAILHREAKYTGGCSILLLAASGLTVGSSFNSVRHSTGKPLAVHRKSAMGTSEQEILSLLRP
jgi:hypothetical protein